MTMPGADGSPSCPLFMDPDDAERAVGNAKPPERTPGVDPKGFDLTILCISLDRAIELIKRRAGGVGFQFVPPRSSVAWLQSGPPEDDDDSPVTRIPGSDWGIRE